MSSVAFKAALAALVADGGNSFDAADEASFLAFGPAICAIQMRIRRLALDVESLSALWDQSTLTAKNHLPAAAAGALPNPTDLAGGDEIKRSDWEDLLSYANQMRAQNADPGQHDLGGTTVLPLMVAAAGVNVQGQV